MTYTTHSARQHHFTDDPANKARGPRGIAVCGSIASPRGQGDRYKHVTVVSGADLDQCI